MMVRSYRVLLFGGGIGVIFLIIALVFLFRANTNYQQQRKILNRQYRRLAELNTRNPFPSEENVVREKQNLERLECQIDEMTVKLARDPFPENAVDAADFSARAQDVIEQFGKQAAEAGVKLPESLEAGFAKYASGGEIPDQAQVPRLSRQLASAEKVADVLVRSGVTSIETLTRENFETQSDSSSPTTGRRDRRGIRAFPTANRRMVASLVQPRGLYTAEQIEVSFFASEPIIWKVLNELIVAPHFMIVTDFSHTVKKDILAYNPEKGVQSGEDKKDAEQFLSSGILSGRKALSRPERIIAGNELLQVSLKIDVYNFDLAPDGVAP
jgi:hypothetical protein